MMYITIEDGRISGMYCGGKPAGSIDVPDNFTGLVGQDMQEFDENYNLKPLSERVANGCMPIPQGYKLDGEAFVPLTRIERYEQKFDAMPEGYEILNGELSRIMTPEILIEEEIGKHLSYLALTDWYAVRFAETGKAIPEDVKLERATTRDRISTLKEAP